MRQSPLALALILGTLLIASGHVLAQTPPAGSAGAGSSAISGVPAGPGAGGINNSVNDPSGIGNAARAPSSPPPAVSGPATSMPSAGAVPAASGSRRGTTPHAGRIGGGKLSPAQQEIAVKENDRLLNQKLKSICRGC